MNVRKLIGGRNILLLIAAALVLVLVLIAILARNPQQASTSRPVAVAPERPAEAPERLGAADPTSPKSADDLTSEPIDLPLPPDVEAMARWFGESGPKRLEDAEVVWQAASDRYVDFLKEETFDQGLRRIYMPSELMVTMGNEGNFDPMNPDIIRLFARTRRFNRLLAGVGQEGAATALDAAVDHYLSQRRAVEQKLLRLIEESPEIFHKDAPEETRYAMTDLIAGYALTGLDVPEGAIPMSLMGTQWGLVANSYLLGWSRDPQAVRPLLKIVDYEDKPFLAKLRAAFPEEQRKFLDDYSVANRRVVVDALDRILVANATRDTIGAKAIAIAKEYVAWRAKRQWPQRGSVDALPYDAPQTPYHLPGAVTGRLASAETVRISLPLGGPQPGEIEEIFQWARRFQESLE